VKLKICLPVPGLLSVRTIEKAGGFNFMHDGASMARSGKGAHSNMNCINIKRYFTGSQNSKDEEIVGAEIQQYVHQRGNFYSPKRKTAISLSIFNLFQ